MTKVFISTFNKKLYESYAHRLIQTYLETDQLIPLVVYVEDDVSFYPKANNVTYRNLFTVEPECESFVKRNRGKKVKSFLDDAVRFSYKVFSQANASSVASKTFYVDSDCIFLSQIPMTWFEECLPDNIFTSFYHRPNSYTETGFIAFNNTLPCAERFYETYREYYERDTIYELSIKSSNLIKGNTDCHAFDESRRKLRREKTYKEKYLGDQSNGHPVARDPFINKYIDHKKGDRKVLSRSPEALAVMELEG